MLCVLNSRAKEGMWLPMFLQQLNEAEMQAMGLELSAETSSTAISFVGNSGSGPWIKNEFGVGAFTFKVPILP